MSNWSACKYEDNLKVDNTKVKPQMKLKLHQVILAKNQDKLWACKVIALFVRYNDLQLSSNKQFQLSLLHPDVLVKKLLKLAKIRQIDKTATKI